MRAAVVQISAWQTARKKLPLWAETEGVAYPEHLSMEQCSSQLTAEYKARLAAALLESAAIEGTPALTDLTGGFGVDATMMARATGARLTFVERNQALCDIAANNMPLLGVEQAEIVCADSVQTLDGLAPQSLIFIDPARRDEHGGKTVAISDCTPDICAISDTMLEKAEWVMVKLSPMLDLASVGKQLAHVVETHIVSVEGECKEVLLVMSKKHDAPQRTVCANIGKDGTADTLCVNESEAQCKLAGQVGRYLYEPNASIMKACAFKSVCSQYGVEKLHPDSHLYTSSALVADFPGRKFEVTGQSSFAKKELKAFLSGTKKANLTVRNFPASVAELRKRLNLAEGGDTYLFATTLADGSHVLIKCKK
jgi:16S rRNA G966 N2-methylase RsmD